MTNGHCTETYDTEETRKVPGRKRIAKAARVVRRAEQPARTETSTVREPEPHRS